MEWKPKVLRVYFSKSEVQNVFFNFLLMYNTLKGTVRVILSDPPLKRKNAQFTPIPFKALSDQV